MRKGFFIMILLLAGFYSYSQKITVKIVSSIHAGISEWQVLDADSAILFPGDTYHGSDTATVVLETGKRFFLHVSQYQSVTSESLLYQVIIEGEPVLMAMTDPVPAEHYYPFFTGTRDDRSKIIGGTSVSISGYPWQVYMIAGNYLCGGSIIGPGWVVTAAHCVRQDGITISPSTISLTVGSSTPKTSGTRYGVSQVIVHDLYSSSTFEYDIALLKVNGTISCTYCNPIKLVNSYDVADGFTDPGRMSYITGWGLINVATQTLPQNLQMAQIPIVSNATASVVWGVIPSTDIMAGYKDGNKDACSGDSGGPMSVVIDGESKLAGIVSWGSTNCNTYGAYTKVSMLESWIRTKTGIYDYALSSPEGDSVVCQNTATSHYTAEYVPGASYYEWKILPADAGTVTWSSNNADISWNPEYTGTVTLKARVMINGGYSDWGRKNIIRSLVTQIIEQPSDREICEKDDLVMRTSATGTDLKFAWFRNDTLLQSGTADSLNIRGAVPVNSGLYRCQVTGLCGSLLTDPVLLTVHPLTVIHNISHNITAEYGSDVTLQVDATGHNLEYLWTQNNEPLLNSNSAMLVMNDMNAVNIGLYRSVVSGTCGIETSDSVYVYLKKNKNGEDPEISVWPTLINDEVNVACGSADKYRIKIVNIPGKVVYDINGCQYQTTVNISTYPKGMYLVNVSGKGFIRTFRVVKN